MNRNDQPEGNLGSLSRRTLLHRGGLVLGASALAQGLGCGAGTSPSDAGLDAGPGETGMDAGVDAGAPAGDAGACMPTGTADWLGSPPEISESAITSTLETEVLVIGAGCGGIFAACAAAEQGAKVLVIDKSSQGLPYVRAELGALNSWVQRQDPTYPAAGIDPSEYARAFADHNSYFNDQRLLRLWLEQSGATMDWYAQVVTGTPSDAQLQAAGRAPFGLKGTLQATKDSTGKPLKQAWEGGADTHEAGFKFFPTGHVLEWYGPWLDAEGQAITAFDNSAPGALELATLPPNTGTTTHGETGDASIGAQPQLQAYAESLGAQFQYKTQMIKLLKSGVRVTGAIVKQGSGYARINASKGVIVATGGYATNTDMLQALQPQTLKMMGNFAQTVGRNGDGIKACLWAGAAMDDVHSSMLFDRCAIPPDAKGGYQTPGSIFWMGSQPFLKVNLKGERFANESVPYDYIVHTAANQPGHCYCTIWDADWQKHVLQFETHGCSRMIPCPNGTPPHIFTLNAWAQVMQGLIAGGIIQQADDLPTLAQKLGLPTDAFQATVTRYNELAAKGLDSDFGKDAYRLIGLGSPPYFGVRQTSFILCTLDGIKIDTNVNALDANGDAIPGLWVVGNDSGSFFANSYMNLSTGIAAGRTVTLGRIAGHNAARG